MKYFNIEPEVAGQLGPNTIINTATQPPTVEKLHYQLDGWLGDDILESYPVFICTEDLAKKLIDLNLSGFILDQCELTKSELFNELYPNRTLPKFYWLKVCGKSQDDFYIGSKGLLIISEKALNVLKDMKIDNCFIKELEK